MPPLVMVDPVVIGFQNALETGSTAGLYKLAVSLWAGVLRSDDLEAASLRISSRVARALNPHVSCGSHSPPRPHPPTHSRSTGGGLFLVPFIPFVPFVP
jgi:hypothetical protein